MSKPIKKGIKPKPQHVCGKCGYVASSRLELTIHKLGH